MENGNKFEFKSTIVTAKIFRSKSGKSLNVCLVDEMDNTKLIGIGFITIASIDKLLSSKSKVAIVQKFADNKSEHNGGEVKSSPLLIQKSLGVS